MAECVSELVTNAVTHTRSGLPGGQVTVCFEALPDRGGLRISVHEHDNGARVTVPAHGPTLPVPAESGYGLGIGAAVAADRGVIRPAGGRSVTWCVIPAVRP